MKSVIATISIAILVTFAFCGKQKNSATENVQPLISETTTILPATGLHEAALTGNIEVIQQHIKAGSDLNEKDLSGGSSPLITAATFGKAEVARALIKAGVDLNYKNNEGSTALHAAAFFCHTEIVEELLDNGADKNIRNNTGSTAMESVAGPFDNVKGIYDYFGRTLGPLGLELDYEQIKQIRPKIAEMLR